MTHCSHGHPYTTTNTGISGGHRYCRQCNRDSHHRSDGNEHDQLTQCPHRCTWTYVVPTNRANIHLTHHRNLMHHGT